MNTTKIVLNGQNLAVLFQTHSGLLPNLLTGNVSRMCYNYSTMWFRQYWHLVQL